MESTANENTMTRYLLGELPEKEAAALEERFFHDDAVFEELRAVEADLIDQYVRGELSGTALRQFESCFLSSAARRQRVDFAKALASAVKLTPAQVPKVIPKKGKAQSAVTTVRPWQFSKWLAIAAILLAVAGAWLTVENRRLARQIDSVQASRSTEESHRQELEGRVRELQSFNVRLSTDLERERSKPQSNSSRITSLVAFVLSPGMVRGTDEPSRIVVPRESAQVKLQLDLETVGNYLSYRAELRTAGGQTVWSQDGLPARSTSWGKVVVLVIPSIVLAPGEHELTLRGLVRRGRFEDSGYYYFSVIKR